MKIGLILSSLPNYSEVFILNKINGLVKYGFEVSLFISSKKDLNTVSLPASTTIFYQLNINNKYNLLFSIFKVFILHPYRCIRYLNYENQSHGNIFKAIKHLILNYHIIGESLDWIHFCFATSSIGKENLARVMKAKMAVSFRGFDIGLYPYKHSNCYKLLWDRIDKVHTISDDLYFKAIKLGLDSNIPVNKINPAIDINYFNTKPKYDFNQPIRILTVGRLNWKKGYDYALKALYLLKNKSINFEYHIIGEGSYKEAIIYAINQLNLNNNVIIKGKLLHKDIKREMKWADLYIQPSIQEGFCNSVLEAQAMGLLCIVTNAEGLSENILDGETGWVISKRSPKELFDKILEILSSDLDSLKRIKEFAMKRVKAKYNINNQNKLFVDFYN